MFPLKTYEIHDNYSRPYVVFIINNRIIVYHNEFDFKQNNYILKGKIMDFIFDKIFIGEDKPKSKFNPNNKNWGLGNTILIKKLNGKYLYIGKNIEEFSLKNNDEIINFFSPIANNDIPYPYAIGKKNIYHLTEKIYFPLNDRILNFSLNDNLNNLVYHKNIKKEYEFEWTKWKNTLKIFKTKILIRTQTI